MESVYKIGMLNQVPESDTLNPKNKEKNTYPNSTTINTKVSNKSSSSSGNSGSAHNKAESNSNDSSYLILKAIPDTTKDIMQSVEEVKIDSPNYRKKDKIKMIRPEPSLVTGLIDSTKKIGQDKGINAMQLPDVSFADFFTSIVGPLVVVGITSFITWLWTKNFTKKTVEAKYQRRVEAAPMKYVQELDKLIQNAHNGGLQNAIVNARAIVAARNSLRGSLTTIQKQLNSEIDQLEKDIYSETTTFNALEENLNRRNGVIDAKSVYDTIQVLQRFWPVKKVQIEVEVRKLITELGLNEMNS